MKRPAAFFKVYIAEINNNDLKIPQAFVQRVRKAFPEKVYLRDRWNNVWPVKVAQVGDDWYIRDGWVKFVDDNFLTSGDILVFEYFCDSLFNVKLYGLSATEKNVSRPLILTDGDEQEQDSEEETESEDHDYIFRRRERDNYEDDEETEDGNCRLVHQEHRHEVREQVNHTDVGGPNRNKAGQWINFSGKYGMEIFQAGLLEQPTNPYFVTKIMPKRKGDLFIPMDIIKYSNLDFTQDMTLVDPKGRKFHAKCKKWKDGRMVVAGGWRSLCRLNFVEQEDRCICEFVQGEGRCLLLNVTFVRARDLR
ncbi:putative B3 domain-containing protein At5g66980 [Sesamum indicum]|uniref:B3 domain-containing protein At5g66980 n=1 Tax=Sesamum indicum TaxID=4182 RepID=A0A8M8V7B9_SESIN|nr:putative B3 domain-containing protein At5g66980 [Sesamum indicum]